MSGTFGGDGEGAYGGFFALQFVCSVAFTPSKDILPILFRTVARVLQSLWEAAVLRSTGFLRAVLYTTGGSRVRESDISLWVTASTHR